MSDDKQYLLERLTLSETATGRLAEIIGAINPAAVPHLRNWDQTWVELLTELDQRYEK